MSSHHRWRTRCAATSRSWLRRAALMSAALLSAACTTLPPKTLALAPPSVVIPDGAATPLGRMAQAALTPPAPSAFRLLPLAASAYESRIEFARRATRSIDLQTFVFQGDATGVYLLAALRDAALRGVRVRLLIDDLHSDGAETLLSDLAAFPHVEVRLVNPYTRLRGSQTAKIASSLDDLERVNQRMHNKVYIADNALALFGGRNIGDEYYMRAATGGNFVDLEMLGAGAVVGELSASFDRYWNGDAAWPIDAVVPPEGREAERRARFDAAAAKVAAPLPDTGVPARLAAFATLPDELRAGRLQLVPATATVVDDPVDKLAHTRVADRHGTVRETIGAAMGAAQTEVFVVSPYFVPGEIGMRVTRANHERGVRLRLITNSLAATDEPAVHAGYIAYRRELLDAGVEIYELSPDLTRREHRLGRFGETPGVLHAKVIVIDRRQLFVGSMNLDGRSERYNTEVGVLIDSEALAREFVGMMDFESSTYRVRLAPDGHLQWVSTAGGTETVYDEEPEVGFWRRFKSNFLGSVVPQNWL